MAARFVLRRRMLTPAMVGAAGALIVSRRTAYAEGVSETPPQQASFSRKPIYDDDLPSETAAPAASDSLTSAPSRTRAPTPTDRLASYIKLARLQLYGYASATEDCANKTLTSALNLENSIATTIANLAPPAGSQERLVPGLLTVLLSIMGSSIVVRNRNVVLRASAPVAVGIGTMAYVLPITSSNVEGLIMSWESKVPGLKERHVAAKERVGRFVSTGRAHAGMSVAMLEEKIGDGRRALEEWISKER